MIVIDCGHGGHDRGGNSIGIPEKDIVLAHGFHLAGYMRNVAELDVEMIRTDDTFVELGARAKIANEAGASAFLSLHGNANTNVNAKGAWCIHMAGSLKSKALAQYIQNFLRDVVGGPKDVYPDDSPWVGNRKLAVLRRTRMPAVIIELGFMTNANDYLAMTTVAMMPEISEAITKGYLAWEREHG